MSPLNVVSRSAEAAPAPAAERPLATEHVEEGPIARVVLPVQASPQVHGWWVREDQYPVG